MELLRKFDDAFDEVLFAFGIVHRFHCKTAFGENTACVFIQQFALVGSDNRHLAVFAYAVNRE